MRDAPGAAHLSGEEILALRYAARRQLARWAKKRQLSRDQYARRTALKRAVAALHHQAFVHGCELHAPRPGQQP
jgi:hypothetical protein